MSNKVHYQIREACDVLGLDKTYVVHCIQSHWVTLAEPAREELDDEDIARVKLIFELQNEFGVNDEAIPIILHLLDQLYAVHSYVKKVA
jgi:chaperone modulatory protein CbpM